MKARVTIGKSVVQIGQVQIYRVRNKSYPHFKNFTSRKKDPH